jgi:hypothetical protein
MEKAKSLFDEVVAAGRPISLKDLIFMCFMAFVVSSKTW